MPEGQSQSAAFSELGLEPRLVDALAALGYEEPTPIQREAIPPLLEGNDLIGQAATGTGKTAAFALPMLHRLMGAGPKRPKPSALILVPTRELAMQVAEATHRYGRVAGISVLPIFGGQSFVPQLRGLERGVDVVVATPGRALDHINRGTLKLENISVVILDEADEMLDLGFADDLEAILGATPEERQTVLFSATLPARINAIARKHLREPTEVRIKREALSEGEVPKVRQTAYIVPRAHKIAALGRILDMEDPEAAIVFCRTRNEVDEVTDRMNAHGYRAEALHGGLSQAQRDQVMRKLRGATADLLVATDVAARGLDIARLSHVINYETPSAPEVYVHRIGRVGRAGREGVAITLAEPREQRHLRQIEQLTKRKISTERLPTVADLRSRQLEIVRASLRKKLLDGDGDRYRGIVDDLAEEFDAREVAAAAIQLAQEAAGATLDDEKEIPTAPPAREERWSGGDAGRAGGKRFGGRQGAGGREERGPRNAAAGKRAAGGVGVTRLFIGAGRNAGVRPQDLVGAITGEAGISGREIGAIDITDTFSIVEVNEGVADEVLKALRSSAIKGKKVTVKVDRGREG